MRTTNAGLDAVLTANNRLAADLYTFYFREGTYRWTSAPTDLTDGVSTWVSTGPLIKRQRGRTTVGLEVDTMNLNLYPNGSTLAGVNMRVAALLGSFDNVRVVVQRALMSTWGTIPLPITVFDGIVVETTPGSTEIGLIVKSGIVHLNQPTPMRVMQVQCPFALGDSKCGVTLATYTTTTTVAAGSTAAVVNIPASSTNANAGGYVQFTSGTMNGLARMIRSVATTAITLAVPLPFAPTVGDGIKIVKGCDKTRTTCRSTFSNIARFGAFPDTPRKDSV